MTNRIYVEKKRPSQKLIDAVNGKRKDIPCDQVRQMLSYNVISIGQLSDLTGVTASTLTSMSVPKINPNARYKLSLTRVYPFPEHKDGNYKPGKLFILRDKECDRLILESNV